MFKEITRGNLLDFISPQYINLVYVRAPFGKYKLNLINVHRDEDRCAFWRAANGCIYIYIYIGRRVRNSATIRDA